MTVMLNNYMLYALIVGKNTMNVSIGLTLPVWSISIFAGKQHSGSLVSILQRQLLLLKHLAKELESLHVGRHNLI
jgi:hypothetical protein